MPRAKTPEPVYPSYGGVNGPRIVQPITLDHEHAVVATREFDVGFYSYPYRVRVGQVADDRSLLVRWSPPDSWRRPTEADRKG